MEGSPTGACNACGTTGLLPGARFCHECGAPTQAQCEACGQELAPGAKFCSGCGASQNGVVARPAPGPGTVQQPVAERRMTSILFGDLVGFTTMSESRDQEEVRELLTGFFDRCRQIVGRYGGTIEKFIGDAVMAVWGVPTAHEDDAERAVRAGLELIRMVGDLGADAGIDGLAMRVGVVTGEVAVTIGAEQQGMVAGDPVNTAARVQAAAAPGEVWVEETTRLLTSAAISYADAGTHAFKGKAEPLPLWAARAVVGSIGGAARTDGLEAPLVGRDRELRLVKEIFHATGESRRASLLVVEGEPGVGKTRLGWEFFKYTDGLTQETLWHQGRCLAYGDGIAFWALAEAVRLRLARLTGRTADEDGDATELISEGLAVLELADDERAWLAPRVGALLGGGGSIGTFSRDELFGAWVTFFERVSGGDEVVFLIDDAQHADEGLISFVEYLLSTADFPCLVALFTRPGLLERRPELATNRRAAVLHLPELGAADMRALVDGLVPGLPDDVATALVARAEGVPLYAVETVRSLIDRDLVVPSDGVYVLVGTELDLSVIGAPATLQALVAARLDALPAPERRVVSVASVLGAATDVETLRALCARVDVDAAVAELTRLQILTRESNRLSADHGNLKFVQSVMRQVAYSTLSRRDRKAVHLAAARHFQTTLEDRPELDAVIAQHYLDAQAAMPAEPDVPELEAAAVDLLVRAAERSAALGVPDDAASHLEQALAHATDPTRRAEIQRRLAQALLECARYAEAVDAARAATEQFEQLGDEVSAGRAVAVWARALALPGDPVQALDLGRPWFERLRDRPEALLATYELVTALNRAEGSLNQGSIDLLDVQLRLADRLGDDAALVEAFNDVSLYYDQTGSPVLSRLFLEAGIGLAREKQLTTALARALVNLVAIDTSRLPEAVELGREALSASLRSGNVLYVETARLNLALGLWHAGGWEEATVVYPEGDPHRLAGLFSSAAHAVNSMIVSARGGPTPAPIDANWSTQAPVDRSWLQLREAVDALAVGDKAAAVERALSAAIDCHRSGGAFNDFLYTWSIAGEMAVGLGDTHALDTLLSLVEDTATEVPLAVQAHRAHLCGLRLRADDPAESEVRLREAVRLFAEWGAVPMRARAQADLGVLLGRQGHTEAADELLASARATFAELGADGWLAELDTELERQVSPG